jgi:hypothetical protein
MKFIASIRATALPALVAALLAGCVYAPVMQPSSYAFDRHPGVVLEVSWRYNYDGSAYSISTLVNRGSVDKCAWTEALDSRLLRAGESWQVSMAQSPGNVGISNVVPQDPNCVNAKRGPR